MGWKCGDTVYMRIARTQTKRAGRDALPRKHRLTRRSRVRFALTQVVLGIDLSRLAVPTHSSPAVVSTEPALRLANPHAGGNMKSRTLTCIIAMTLFAALALPIESAAPRTNGLIAFTQRANGTDGPATVFIANPDGSNVQQVQLPPDDPAETFGVPIWSPDGTELLISHTFRCDNFGNCFFQPATVDPSGSNFNQLVPPNPPGASSGGMDCEAWFPGGTRILCGFDGNPNAGVFSINASDG